MYGLIPFLDTNTIRALLCLMCMDCVTLWTSAHCLSCRLTLHSERRPLLEPVPLHVSQGRLRERDSFLEASGQAGRQQSCTGCNNHGQALIQNS